MAKPLHFHCSLKSPPANCIFFVNEVRLTAREAGHPPHEDMKRRTHHPETVRFSGFSFCVLI